MERRKFEDSFKEAFNGAEASPSENVWTNIELELEKADGGKIRRRLMFYKLLAAASVTFAMCIAGIGYYVLNDSSRNFGDQSSSNSTGLENKVTVESESNSINPGRLENTPENTTGSRPEKENFRAEAHRVDGQKVDHANSSTHGSSQELRGSAAPGNLKTSLTDQAGKLSPAPVTTDEHAQSPLFSETKAFGQAARSLPTIYSSKNPELVFKNTEPDPGALLLAKLAQEEQAYAAQEKREEKNNSERLWTSVGFAAGGFSSINSSVSAASASSLYAMNNSSVPDKQAKASGVAYSYGVNLGAKLSKRWVLQGGVNYLTQSSDYTATNVIGDNNFRALKAESVNELPLLADLNKLAPTVPYSVNNNVQFFSVPVQAGFLIVNKKFGLQMNAGVSTDLFLQNTITPEGGSLDKTTQGRGEDSPYRSVNFSGLMGTELTYRFGQRYRVALNPGLRYPLNSVYKTDLGIQSTPLTFDVGLRFRYIFH